MNVTSIAEQLLFTTIRIESVDSDKNLQVGTGFIFSYEVGNEHQKMITQYIVTNKHVINNGEEGRFTFLTGTTEKEAKLGDKFHWVVHNGFKDMWFGNKDEKIDVAIFPINDLFLFFSGMGESIFYRNISNSLIPSEESLKEVDALEEVIFIGYPWGLWDEKNFLPVFRKGITASPITLDFNGEKKFLIDGSVFPGSSGSPVFLFNRGAFNPKSGGIKMGTRLLFLGILSDAYTREIEGKMRYYVKKTSKKQGEKVVPVPSIDQFFNIGTVFKASTIVDTIQQFLPHYQEWRKRNVFMEKNERV